MNQQVCSKDEVMTFENHFPNHNRWGATIGRHWVPLINWMLWYESKAHMRLPISKSVIVTLVLASFQFSALKMTPPLFHPNFRVFPLDQIADVGAGPSQNLNLISREIIIFESTSTYAFTVSQRHRQIDTGCSKKRYPCFNFAITSVNVHRF